MLTDLDVAIIALESRHWRYEGAKQEQMRLLGLSPTGYYQRLNALLDDPAAIAHDPLTINRLRHQRQTRRDHILRTPA
jgi:hypothetical protein